MLMLENLKQMHVSPSLYEGFFVISVTRYFYVLLDNENA